MDNSNEQFDSDSNSQSPSEGSSTNEIKDKLYLRPIPLSYSMEDITEMFSVYGKIVETYISNSQNNFRWGFILFENEDDANRAYQSRKEHPFKIDFAVKKTKARNYANGLKNGDVEDDVSSYDCVFCKKNTLFYCVTCKNNFCSHNCSLDGWRFHKDRCIYVPKLYHRQNMVSISRQKQVSEVVVSFMKKINSSRQKFSSDEFATVCGGSDVPNYENRFTNYYRKRNSTSCNDDGANQLSDKWDSDYEDDSGKDSEQQGPESHLNERTDRISPKLDLKNNNDYSANRENTKRNAVKNCEMNRVEEKFDSRKHNYDRSMNSQKFETDLNKGVDRRLEVDDNHYADSKKRERKTVVRNGIDHISEKYGVEKRDCEKPKSILVKEEIQLDCGYEYGKSFLKPGLSKEVVVTYIASNRIFFVADFEQLTDLTNEIQIESEKSVKLNRVEKNGLYMVCLESSWYRGRIVSMNPLEVILIDFGSVEECELKNLRRLPERFNAIGPLAVKAKLHDDDINFEEGMEIMITPLKFKESLWVVKLG